MKYEMERRLPAHAFFLRRLKPIREGGRRLSARARGSYFFMELRRAATSATRAACPGCSRRK